jgi:ATP sulfurylase|nr:MAG TPA: hypothetical protein [Caudoviricetes sp.]DAE88573.1 MAG TPA: hypothetical protein [Caudoviricetes sp.]
MIEVNEYVRTKKGAVGKLIEIDKKATAYYLDCLKCVSLKNIVKHSKQLIDLIEVGDIVRIRTGLYSSFMEFIDNEECLLILKEQVKKFWTIEEILTKEQYLTNCYKVGGEDEC